MKTKFIKHGLLALCTSLLICSCGGGGSGGTDDSSSSSNTSDDSTPYVCEFEGNSSGGGRYELTPTSAYAGTVSATINAFGDKDFMYTGQRIGQGTYVWTTKPSDSSNYAVLKFTLNVDDYKVVSKNVESTVTGGYYRETISMTFTNENKTSASITQVESYGASASAIPVYSNCSFSSTPH